MADAEIMSPLATLADEINELHGLVERASANARRAAGEAIQLAIDCGGMLAKAKESCGHGNYGDWLETNFAGSERTAQLYAQLWRGRHHLESATVADLTLNGAAKLVSKAVKEAERNAESLDEIDAAETECVDPADLGQREHAPEPVEADAAGKVAKIAQRLEAAQAIVGAAEAEMRGLRDAAEGSAKAWLTDMTGMLSGANGRLVDFMDSGMRGGDL
jgi:hypothetical protein